jgi:decaprenylphospho-beta-D-erythro-pentofuranosid-2-ulose 2-reductase
MDDGLAAVRTRDGLLTYGVAKAALDLYARRIATSLRGTGVRVRVVRPGHVRTRMTSNLPEPPLTTDPGEVAARVRSTRHGHRTVTYAPAALGPVMAVLRSLPAPLYHRIADPKPPKGTSP